MAVTWIQLEPHIHQVLPRSFVWSICGEVEMGEPIGVYEKGKFLPWKMILLWEGEIHIFIKGKKMEF